MSKTALEKAMHFIEHEKQFHLGFLPTEQSSPLTRNMDKEFAASVNGGVRNLQSVDRNVEAMAKKIFASNEYRKLVDAGEKVIRSGGRIVFSGCGATGRLSILLESMWRKCCDETPEAKPYYDQVFSIMTGGDFALVKSVEFFEDYQIFGCRQVQELEMNERDMLVAITEGGETSSVLGTVFEALDRKCQVFLMFNNPADLLAEHLERSCKAIRDPRVCVLDLFCGPMALAGSTRMQATTSEQLIAGAALETIMCRLIGSTIPDYAPAFEKLLDELENDANVQAMADYIVYETDIYKKKALVTYFADDYMLDIFTDTTERSPTFMLPPFRRTDDTVSAQSWAFVKDPLFSTPDAWQNAMARDLRCLNWTMADYEAMGVTDRITSAPAIGTKDLLAFPIGNEPSPERAADSADTVVTILMGEETCDAALLGSCAEIMKQYPAARTFCVGSPVGDFAFPAITLSCQTEQPLRLLDHIVLKLILNTISTGVMVKYGRVSGNWMSFVALSNKKLIDRGIRLVSGLGKISYEDAAYLIFDAMEQTENMRTEKGERICAVQYALANIGR